MGTTTLTGIPICRTGTWNASTGQTPVTPDDLAAMVQAEGDHLIDRPPLKIGHRDHRFATADGDPAHGWVHNLRLADNGNTLLADIAGIPAKLAEIIPTAWRRRSAEIRWGVKTASGKTHRAVLTGLALLGTTAPAVKGLSDVLALYSDTHPDTDSALVEFVDDTTLVPQQTEFSADGGSGATPTGAGENASSTGGAAVAVSKEKLREALGLPADATDEQVTKALTEAGYTTPAADGDKADTDGENADTDGEPAPAGTPADPTPAAKAAGDKGETEGTRQANPTTQVDAAQFAELAASNTALSARLAEIEARDNAARRQHILNQALQDGKIHPTTVTQYASLLSANETETVKLIDSLPAVLPVTEFGHADPAGNTNTEDADKAFAAQMGIAF